MAILGGDVSPIDVVAHIPVMCEDRGTLPLFPTLLLFPLPSFILHHLNYKRHSLIIFKTDIPYIYISSRQKLGQAAGTKRPTSIVLVTITDSSTNKKVSTKEKKRERERERERGGVRRGVRLRVSFFFFFFFL